MTTPNKPRADWEAIERDYRTGRHTLRELEAMHGSSAAAISRRTAKQGSTKDLREVIQQATNAALIAYLTATTATDAQRDATSVVLAAAETIMQVILAQRSRIQTAVIEGSMEVGFVEKGLRPEHTVATPAPTAGPGVVVFRTAASKSAEVARGSPADDPPTEGDDFTLSMANFWTRHSARSKRLPARYRRPLLPTIAPGHRFPPLSNMALGTTLQACRTGDSCQDGCQDDVTLDGIHGGIQGTLTVPTEGC